MEKEKNKNVADSEELNGKINKARRLDAYAKNLQTLRRRKKEDDYGKHK